MTVTYLSLWKGEIRVIDRSKSHRPQPGNARLEEILRKACEEFNITIRQMRGPSREAWLVDARQEAAFRMHHEGASTTRIGAVLSRDHTSIMNLLQRRERKFA
jgi:chromosomal replication initiation ATPase DnaA